MHKIWGESVPNLRGEFWRNKQKTQNVVIMYPGQTQNIVPSVDKGKHACQCAFAAHFCPSKPCLPLSTDGMKEAKQKKNTAIGGEGDLYSGMNQMEKGKEQNGERG